MRSSGLPLCAAALLGFLALDGALMAPDGPAGGQLGWGWLSRGLGWPLCLPDGPGADDRHFITAMGIHQTATPIHLLANLSGAFYEKVVKAYAGTRLGRP